MAYCKHDNKTSWQTSPDCVHSVHAMLLQEVVDDPTGNKMLLVMDYMEGGPVMTRDALEKGRCIPEPLALQYFRDMLKASQTCAVLCERT